MLYYNMSYNFGTRKDYDGINRYRKNSRKRYRSNKYNSNSNFNSNSKKSNKYDRYRDRDRDDDRNRDRKRYKRVNSTKKKEEEKKENKEEEKKKDKNDDCCSDDCYNDLYKQYLDYLTSLDPDLDKKTSSSTKSVCNNPLCNHKTFEEDPTMVETLSIKQIDDINDLISLGKSYHCKKNREINGINLRLMCNLVAPLNELNLLIGMKAVKTRIVDQILFFLQGYHKITKCGKCIDCAYGIQCVKDQDDMLHTIITGPTGVGKTEVGKILGKVYKAMGILKNDTFKLVKRSDLIAGYLGQTALKTQKLIDECRGGVMFIDEAYSLGSSEKRDSFAKECIDTLTQNLSENRDFLCIIAGYKDALEDCFFSQNEGLRRRFTFSYDIVPYDWADLFKIFEKKVSENGFTIKFDNEINKLFEKNEKKFKNNGGDIETLLLNCKIAHSRTMISRTLEEKYELSIEDIKKGFETFIESREDKKKKDVNDAPPNWMYM